MGARTSWNMAVRTWWDAVVKTSLGALVRMSSRFCVQNICLSPLDDKLTDTFININS